MTTKQLRSYRSICAEIEDKRADLNTNHKVKIAVSSASDYPHSKHTVTDEGYDLSIPGTREKLDELYELKKKRNEIKKFVNGIKDYITRKAVRLYYIEPIEDGEDKPTWETVADKIGNGVTSGALKEGLRRFIKKS